MEIKDLKIVFDNGGLKKATITKNIMGVGYIVLFDAKDKKNHTISGQRTKGDSRVFKTIDAATKNIHEIGFREITIKF
jgi:hypothetical protein